jgi:hypothetical protein
MLPGARAETSIVHRLSQRDDFGDSIEAKAQESTKSWDTRLQSFYK